MCKLFERSICMKKYEKPVMTVLPDVAEGVYAASGNPDPKISDLIVVNNWGERWRGKMYSKFF